MKRARPLALGLAVWLMTPGSEHTALTDAAWSVCEAMSGDDAWRCEDRWYKQGSGSVATLP